MADEPQDEFVYVRMGGDTTAPPGRVSRAAYEQIWKGKGWTIVDSDEAELALSPETLAEMEVAADEPKTTTRKRG